MTTNHSTPGIALGRRETAEAEIDDLENIGFGEIVLPSLVPGPRTSEEERVTSVSLSDGATIPSEVRAMRERLRAQVARISRKYKMDLPADDIELVGTELWSNAIHSPRRLTRMTMEYARPRGVRNRRRAGRLALLVSDDEPGFPEDPDRKDFHRGLSIVAALSSSFGYFLAADGDGKTVFAEFQAKPLPAKATYRTLLGLVAGRYHN